MKKVGISQSNYIPWKGYFDLINKVDEFVIFDDMQYTRRDWRNRNKILTTNGPMWLTVPVDVKGKYHQRINETKVSEPGWSSRHWDTIRQFYSKAKYFKEYKPIFENFYLGDLGTTEIYLSKINFELIKIVNQILGIQTKLRWSNEFCLIEGQTEKLLCICEQLDADVYVSGPAAKQYFDEKLAIKKDMQVEWMDYTGYPEYYQLHQTFEHGVSILDLLFNEGPNAPKYMKSFC